MTQNSKLAAGTSFPKLIWPTVGGGTLDVAAMPGWRLLAVYRGKHCPLCKRYFKTLDGLLDDFKAAGVAVAAVSADPKEKAEADVAEQGWRFPVGLRADDRADAHSLASTSPIRARRRRRIGRSPSPACSWSIRTATRRSSTSRMLRSRAPICR